MTTDKWDARFIGLAQHIATWSKDHGRHVGAVIVGPDNEVRSTGYNGIPRGVNDEIEARHCREDGAKYLWTSHAERNSIYNAARFGVAVKGCSLYSTLFPCSDCAMAIIQSGIKELVTFEPDFNDTKYGEIFKISVQMFYEAGVIVRYLPKEA